LSGHLADGLHQPPSATLSLSGRAEPVDEWKSAAARPQTPGRRDIATGAAGGRCHSDKEGGRCWVGVESTVCTCTLGATPARGGSCCRSAAASSSQPKRLRRGIGSLLCIPCVLSLALQPTSGPWTHALDRDIQCVCGVLQTCRVWHGPAVSARTFEIARGKVIVLKQC